MATTDGPVDPVEGPDDVPEAVGPGGAGRPLGPQPGPDEAADSDADPDESAREQAQQTQQ
jgi:hypothetical protein